MVFIIDFHFDFSSSDIPIYPTQLSRLEIMYIISDFLPIFLLSNLIENNLSLFSY